MTMPKNWQLYLVLGFAFALLPNEAAPDGVEGADKGSKAIPGPDAQHPLDPLTASEIRLAALIIRTYNGSSPWQFKFIGLREPNKTLLYPYFISETVPPYGQVPRKANVLLTCPIIRRPIWVVVNLSALKVESWDESPTEKVAVITVEDISLASKIALSNPSVIARIQALGYNGLDDVVPGICPAEILGDNPEYTNAAKIVQVYFYGLTANGTNYFSHPFDFLAIVELGADVVRDIQNLPIHDDFDTTNRTGNSVPQEEKNYFPELLPQGTIQTNLRPVVITQPGGHSFDTAGYEVRWLNFKMRIGWNPREGLYLNTITFKYNDIIHPLIYRMSLSEVYLQYGDPRPPYHSKASMDEATFEFGSSARSLPVHQFCRGDAYYYDATHHNEKGEPWIVKNSVCIREEDADILWAHYDFVSGRTAVTRSQRLAISTLVTIENTGYWITWRFYQDATIELAVRVTGILSTNLMAVDVKAPLYGTLVAPQVYTQIYQHFFAVRIDVDIDGRNNTVATSDIARVSETLSPENPYGNGMIRNITVLSTPSQAVTDNVPARTWNISNWENINPVTGDAVAWKLWSYRENPQQASLLTPDSPINARIPWANHSMWVLPYDPDQIFAGGKYLTDGVAKWTEEEANTDIVQKDIVLWHTFNYVHSPDVEWPVISSIVDVSGFRMRPAGFFTENPAITVPPASETTAMDGTGSCSSSSPSQGISVSPGTVTVDGLTVSTQQVSVPSFSNR